MASYVGTRTPTGELVVTKKGRRLALRTNIINHSPTGFECGYSGSGPAQLALAIAYDRTQSAVRATELHQELKRRLVMTLPKEGFSITEEEVDQVIKDIEEGT